MEYIYVYFNPAEKASSTQQAPGLDLTIQDLVRKGGSGSQFVKSECGPCEFSSNCVLKAFYDKNAPNEVVVNGICLKNER